MVTVCITNELYNYEPLKFSIMKKFTLNFIVLICLISAQTFCFGASVPDAFFEQQLIDEGIDSDATLNGLVSDTDLAAATFLYIDNANITDLTGLEAMIGLQSLSFAACGVTTLDLSTLTSLTSLNIDSSYGNNAINSLTLGGSAASLTQINLTASLIASVDCSNCTNLTDFYYEEGAMNTMSSIVLTNSSSLTTLQIGSSNYGNDPFNPSASIDFPITCPNLINLWIYGFGVNRLPAYLDSYTSLQNIAFTDYSTPLVYGRSADLSNLPNLKEVFLDDKNMEFLNIANGNNGSLVSVGVGDPLGCCIRVDDASASLSVFNGLTITDATLGDCPRYLVNPTTDACTSIATVNFPGDGITKPIVDGFGNILCYLNDKGNNLGDVEFSVWVSSTVRTIGPLIEPYIDRDLTITPTNQPTSPVEITMFYTDNEMQNLTSNSALISYPPDAAQVSIIHESMGTCDGSIDSGSSLVPVTSIEPVLGNWKVVYQVSSFSSFTLSSANVVITAVELNNLEAKADGVDINLSWSTTNEDGNSGFAIEHSFNGNDWNQLDIIPSKGVSNKPQQYSYAHRNAYNGLNFYRLNIDDQEYSNIVSVLVENDNRKGVDIWPNPVSKQFNLSTGEKIKSVYIINRDGRIMNRIDGKSLIDVSALTPGNYFIKVITDQSTEIKQITVQ